MSAVMAPEYRRVVPPFCKKRHFEKSLKAYQVPFHDLPADCLWLQHIMQKASVFRSEAEDAIEAASVPAADESDLFDNSSEAVSSSQGEEPKNYCSLVEVDSLLGSDAERCSEAEESDCEVEDGWTSVVDANEYFQEDGSESSTWRSWSIAWMGRSPMLVRRCEEEDDSCNYSVAASPALFPRRVLRECADADIDATLAHVLRRADARCCAIIALNAGYFAGAIFSGSKVIAHKCFKRYTTRKKQGGSQSSFDAGGRKAKSAGSNMRREGEKRLQEEVQELLTQTWAAELAACEHIYISVSNRTKAKLLGPKETPFVCRSKVRSLPFIFGRPSLAAVREAHLQLTSLYFADSTRDHAFRPGKSKQPGQQTADADAASSQVDDEGSTALHAAAAAGDTELILELLQGGADPTAQDAEGRVPFELCAQGGGTRRGQCGAAWAFRFWREQQPEDAYNWDAAKIPCMDGATGQRAAPSKPPKREKQQATSVSAGLYDDQEDQEYPKFDNMDSKSKSKGKEVGKGKGRCQGKAKGHAANASSGSRGAPMKAAVSSNAARPSDARSNKRVGGGKHIAAPRAKALF